MTPLHDKVEDWGPRFSYAELVKFLEFAREVAPVVPMRDHETANGRVIVLRQDADLDVIPSYDVAQLQKRIGIRSTFFVLTTAFTYNPRSARVRGMLREMVGDGFEIGLHFDPTVYGNATRAELVRAVELESSILGEITGEPVRSIALHNPSVLNEWPTFDGYINAGSPELFENARYLSDSMRVDPTLHPYRGKDPYGFLKNASAFPLQITLHPEQFLEHGGDYVDSMTRYSARLSSVILRDYVGALEAIRKTRAYELPDT